MSTGPSDIQCFQCRDTHDFRKEPKCHLCGKSAQGFNMSTEKENIITGLKLSEAVKLLEENEGALIKPDDYQHENLEFRELKYFDMEFNRTYSVKLPPPKSVSVTREMLKEAWLKHVFIVNELQQFEKLCKELGL
jgi:hypothetical protein